MIGFEMHRNGERVTTAGLEGFAVLSAILTWVRRRNHSARAVGREEELSFSLSGAESNGSPARHACWWSGPVRVGDEILLRVLDVDRPDPPQSSNLEPELKLRTRNMNARARYIRELERELKSLKSEDRARAKPKTRKTK